MMPPSDNFVAEGLWFRSARELEPEGPMTFTRAAGINNKRLREWLGVSPGALSLDDGSGLTRTNVSTGRTIASLLRKMAMHPNQAIWRECMARPGIGTLAGRLKGVDFIGKTGTLNMVVSLSGYVKRRNRSEVVVSVVVNHFAASPSEVRDLIDRFIANVAELPL
jgi:D-alanyl-D-alanine carboxypeptidase/D-alanyl-D-alanine-endopeptidase (penicillin-binding protein 4)